MYTASISWLRDKNFPHWNIGLGETNTNYFQDLLGIMEYKKPRCNFSSPLKKTLDWNIETLGRECNLTGL